MSQIYQNIPLNEASECHKGTDFLIINRCPDTFVLIRNEVLQELCNNIPDSDIKIACEDATGYLRRWGLSYEYGKEGCRTAEIKYHRMRKIKVTDIPQVIKELELLGTIYRHLNKVSVVSY